MKGVLRQGRLYHYVNEHMCKLHRDGVFDFSSINISPFLLYYRKVRRIDDEEMGELSKSNAANSHLPRLRTWDVAQRASEAKTRGIIFRYTS